MHRSRGQSYKVTGFRYYITNGKIVLRTNVERMSFSRPLRGKESPSPYRSEAKYHADAIKQHRTIIKLLKEIDDDMLRL